MSKNAKPFSPDSSAETETKIFEYKACSLSSTKKLFGPSEETLYFNNVIEQCFLKMFLRNPRFPQRGVGGSKRRKCVMAGRVLLAVLNLFERIKIRVTTFDTNHYVTGSTQTIAA